jgi:outer membrane protein assembly factor BamB
MRIDWRYLRWLFPLFVLLTLMGCQPDTDDNGEPTPTFTPGVVMTPFVTPEAPVPAIPPEVEQYADEWPMANKDYANTRAALNAGIDSNNVNTLGLAWTFDIPGVSGWGAAASAPIIGGGIVYFQDLASNVFALELQSGRLIWEWQRNEATLGPNGPAIGYGKIFAQGGVNTTHALDMHTGQELWATALEGPTGSHQPYVYDGMVYSGLGAGAVVKGTAGHVQAREGYGGGTSGMVYAIDHGTGEIHWRFITVEEGFWGNPEVNSGAGIWFPPAIDTETGLTYWGTGNPAPFPGTLEFPNASSRPGPNPYANALIALQHDTGDLVCYHLAKPFDLFDLDYQLPPILATTNIGGQSRDIVIASGKLGHVFAYDRSNCEVLWDTPVGEHQNDTLLEIPLGVEVLVLPGVWGGVEAPMALADDTLYLFTANLGTPYTATGHDAEDGAEAVANVSGRTRLDTGTGEMVAIDIRTGDILWTHEFDRPGFGGATVINDLVFTALLDGSVYALARDDGRIVWNWQAPGGIIAWPAVAGDTIIYPVGIGSRPVLVALRPGAQGTPPPPDQRPTPRATPGQ